MIFNLNGRFVDAEQAHLPCNDSAVLFGDSLFETLKAKEEHIQFLDQHLDRLELAARLLDFPFNRQRLHEALLATTQRLSTSVARLRLTLSRGPMAGLALPSDKNGNFFVSAAPYQEPSAEERRNGVACVFAPNRRVNPLSHLPQMKRGNYADCLYAADYARRKGAREALFQTVDGLVLEGATSNLFIVSGETLITPTAGELVLAGIMRRQVQRAAEHLQLPTVERPIAVKDLWAAEEAFLTNSLIDLLPIAQIEGRPLKRGPWAKRLAKAVAREAAGPPSDEPKNP